MDLAAYERFKKEIVALVPSLAPKADVVSSIVDAMADRGIEISTTVHEKRSKIEFNREAEAPWRIRVCPFSGTAQNPLNPLWEIIHEFGHFLGGQPPEDLDQLPVGDRIGREGDAWYAGWEWTRNRPGLADCEFQYAARKTECIEDYERGLRGRNAG